MELIDRRRILFSKSEDIDYEYSTNESSFCNCMAEDPMICGCGEDNDGMCLEWAWDEHCATATTLLSNKNHDVKFHPGYSSGTAAIRGDSSFKQGHIYYWEIKMLTSLYGTDVMVGIGTKKAQLNKAAYQFCSLLGSDKESWGFSYKGKFQHNGVSEWYGPPFGKGSIIGIYLDMWKGTLEFFLNRRPLGVAVKSLRGKKLYPMVCSTAAKSAMRVTYAVSQPVDLKLLSLQALRSDSNLMGQLALIPGLRRFIASTWWIGSGTLYDDYTEVCLRRPTRKRLTGCPCVHQPHNETHFFSRVCPVCDIIL